MKEIVKTLPKDLNPELLRSMMMEFERKIAELPNAVFGNDACPLTHTFVEGAYVRQITMPKGMILTSKIHKIKHPFFVMEGDCSVLTDEGVVRIKAPYWGVTEANTKRVLYIHEETIWVTVHVTDSTDIEEIERQIIEPSDNLLPYVKKEELLIKEE